MSSNTSSETSSESNLIEEKYNCTNIIEEDSSNQFALPSNINLNSMNVKSAGAIIIDPWENMYNHKYYNILCIKQRLGMSWGLPKGHVEQGETLYESSVRELCEETGIDLHKLVSGKDYLPVILYPENIKQNTHNNHTVIKKIHFFVFVLLKRGSTFARTNYDRHEIADVSWINVNTNKLLIQKNYNNHKYQQHFDSNRTLSESSIANLCEICKKTCVFLKKILNPEQIYAGHQSSNYNKKNLTKNNSSQKYVKFGKF